MDDSAWSGLAAEEGGREGANAAETGVDETA